MNLKRLMHQMAKQGKGQKTIGDGGRIRRLALRPLLIQMNPLAVISRLSKSLDAGLRDLQPLADGNLTPDKIFSPSKFLTISGGIVNAYFRFPLYSYSAGALVQRASRNM